MTSPRTVRHHLGLLLVAVVLATAGGLATVAPVQASEGACTQDAAAAGAATVVVDFRSLDQPTVVRCTDGPVESGFDALTTVGLSYDQSIRFPGLLCRIEGLPADESCGGAPPSDRYWSYWYAEPGDTTWTYAATGAAQRTPPPGSAEGWSFSTDPDASDGQPPRVAPPVTAAAPTPAPEPTPTPSPSPTPTPTATSAPTPAPSRTSTPTPTARPTEDLTTAPRDDQPTLQPEPGPDPAPTPGPDAPTPHDGPATVAEPAAPSPAPSASPSTSSPTPDRTRTTTDDTSPQPTATPDDLDATAAASSRDDGGSPLAVVAVVVLAAGLGVGGSIVVRRRQAAP